MYYIIYAHLDNEFDNQSFISRIYTNKEEADATLIKLTNHLDKDDPDCHITHFSLDTFENPT